MYNSTKTEQGKERVYLFVIGLLLVLATYKYVCRGEAYIFETGRSTETVTITAERVLSQNIIIDKKAFLIFTFSFFFCTMGYLASGIQTVISPLPLFPHA